MAAAGHPRHRIGRPQRAGRQRHPVAGAAHLAAQPATQAHRQLVDPALEVAQRPGGGALEPRAELRQRVDHRLLLAHHQLGGGRRCGRAEVGDEVGDREVHLVAHRRHHRYLRTGDGSRDDLLVESREIFDRPAAAADDDDVDIAQRVEIAERPRDVLGGAVALHLAGRDHDRELAETAPDDAKYVLDRRAGRRGADADLASESRQLALARLIEETLGREPGLELLEGELERAESLRLQQLHDQVILAPLRVDLDAAEGQDVQAVGGLEPNPTPPAPEERGAQLRVGVLQREVRVARAVEAKVGDLAFDPHRGEALLDHLAQPRRQLGNCQHRAVGAHTLPAWRSAARSVLRRSIAIVMGPTPPGTGVIARTRSETPPRSTSPTTLPVARRLMPTSITHALSFTMSFVTVPARPAATHRTSARRVWAMRSRVRVWHVVTVACRASRSCASGLPTRRERPITTASAPFSSHP